jgi:hypothetical protein
MRAREGVGKEQGKGRCFSYTREKEDMALPARLRPDRQAWIEVIR